MRQSSATSHRSIRDPRYFLACLFAASFPLTTLAGTYNWNSAINGQFNIPGYWNPSTQSPGTGDLAVFNVAGTYTVTFTSSPTNGAFLVQNGNVTWNAGANAETYALTGSPSVSGGNLTLGSAGVFLTVSIPGSFGVEGTGSPILNVTGNGTLSSGSIELGDIGISGWTGTINDSSNITQTGASTLTIGAASSSSGTLNLNVGVYNTGTGLTTINAKGKINLNGGTFNANGNITATGGSLSQSAGTFTWAGNHTMLIQSGGNVSLVNGYTTPTNANITVTGSGSLFSEVGNALQVNNGATLNVNSGATVFTNIFTVASIYDSITGNTGSGNVTVDGANSSLVGDYSTCYVGTGGNGTLTYSNGASGSFFGFNIGSFSSAGGNGTLNVLSNATVTSAFDIGVATSNISATGTINVTGGTLTQTGASNLSVGASSVSTATVTIGANGTFTTGTGNTTINATGQINVSGGTLNANGNITVTGGLLNQTSGTFSWASSKTMTIQSGGNVSLAGEYTTPRSATINVTGTGSQFNNIVSSTADLDIDYGATLSVTSGGLVHSDLFLDIAFYANANVTVDGSGSSFSSAATNNENFLGTAGTGSLTFSNSATGSAPGGFQIGSAAGSSGTINVQSSAVLNCGPLDIADQGASAIGIINVNGGTLTQSGGSYLTVGQASAFGGTATVTIGNSTTSGTFTTGTSLTSIYPTGKINLISGTFNANGDITVTGGSLIQTGGSFKWAGNHTMLIQSGGNVTLLAGYTTPTNANITVTGPGSLLTDLGSLADLKIFFGCNLSVTSGASVHSDVFVDIAAGSGNGAGTVTIDGNNSSLTTNATSSTVQNFLGTAGPGSLTFSSSATGSLLNGFAIGHAAGTSGTLNVQSNATLTTGSLNVGDQGTSNTGIINVAGGTLIQAGNSTLLIGAASLSTATVTIGTGGTGGTFTSGTGLTTINATGTFNLQPTGTANFNGNVTNSGGNLTLAGAQTWATTTSLTNTAGKTTFSSNAKLYGLSITAGTVDLTTAKIIVEAASNKSATLTTLRTDVTNASLLSSTAAAANTLAGRTDQVVVVSDNAIRMAAFPTTSSTFGGNPADSNSILLTATYLGDANLDGQVNILDLQDLANHWQQSVTDWSQADFNGDGLVNILDLQALANHWQFGVGVGGGSGSNQAFSEALASIGGLNATPTSNVPEPTSLALLTPAAAFLLRRRRNNRPPC